MKNYRSGDTHNFTVRYKTRRNQSSTVWEGQAKTVEQALFTCQSIEDDDIAFVEYIDIDGSELSDSAIDKVNKDHFAKVDECDGGGAAGGDVGGAAAGGDAGAGAAASADAGDIAGEMAGTSTTDVLGKFEPSKGVMGANNFMVPAMAIAPLHRWEIGNGGSVRKKGKNGKPKKTPYEKGMKVVVSMFEDDGSDVAKAEDYLNKTNLKKKVVFSHLKKLAKTVKSMDDANAVEKKFSREKSTVANKLSSSRIKEAKQVCLDFGDFLKDICKGSYKASWFTISMVVVGLVYILSPVDLIPDFIPGIGVIDDAFVIMVIYSAIKDEFEEWKLAKKLAATSQDNDSIDMPTEPVSEEELAHKSGEWEYWENMPEANGIEDYDHHKSMHIPELKAQLQTHLKDVQFGDEIEDDDGEKAFEGFKKFFDTKAAAMDYAEKRLHDELLAYEDDTRYYVSNEEWEADAGWKLAEYEEALENLKSEGECCLTDGRHVTWECSVKKA